MGLVRLTMQAPCRARERKVEAIAETYADGDLQ